MNKWNASFSKDASKDIKKTDNPSLQSIPIHAPFPLFIDTSTALSYSRLPSSFLESRTEPQHILVGNSPTKNEDHPAVIKPVLKSNIIFFFGMFLHVFFFY